MVGKFTPGGVTCLEQGLSWPERGVVLPHGTQLISTAWMEKARCTRIERLNGNQGEGVCICAMCKRQDTSREKSDAKESPPSAAPSKMPSPASGDTLEFILQLPPTLKIDALAASTDAKAPLPSHPRLSGGSLPSTFNWRPINEDLEYDGMMILRGDVYFGRVVNAPQVTTFNGSLALGVFTVVKGHVHVLSSEWPFDGCIAYPPPSRPQ